MSTKSKVRCALYARVSTANHGQDVGLQVEALRRLAQQRGWQVSDDHIYVDVGVSGTKDSRPALDRMMAAVRSGTGGIGIVAVWKFDRFARSTTHLMSALDEFRRNNVEFISVTESVDTSTPVGKMVYMRLSTRDPQQIPDTQAGRW